MSDKPLKGRPAHVKWSVWDIEKRELLETEADARFHCWGNRPPKKIHDGEGLPPRLLNGMETVGICELKDGSVKLIRPERIQFLDVEAPCNT